MLKAILASVMLILSGCVTYSYYNQGQPTIVTRMSHESGVVIKGVYDDSILGDWRVRNTDDVITISRSDNKSYITVNGTKYFLFHTTHSDTYIIIDYQNIYFGTLTMNGWLTENSIVVLLENGVSAETLILIRQDVSND